MMIEPMKPINEFQGFEVFIPSHAPGSSQIQITISKTGCRLSKAALSELKYPEYVNVFFDYTGKRMMITAADKRMQNIMKLSKQGNCPNTLSQKCFTIALAEISGSDESRSIPGHKTGRQNSLIFEFDKEQK